MVVRAGSYASPAILMRSGIGPRRAARPGHRGGRRPAQGRGEPNRPPAGRRRPAHHARLYRASVPGDAHPALAAGRPGRAIRSAPFRRRAVRRRREPGRRGTRHRRRAAVSPLPGSVRLRSADPADPPRIDAAHLRHPEDMTRMIEAIRHARRLSRIPPLPVRHPRRARTRPRDQRRRHPRAGPVHPGTRRLLPPPGKNRRGGPRNRPTLGGRRIGNAGHPRREHQADYDRDRRTHRARAIRRATRHRTAHLRRRPAGRCCLPLTGRIQTGQLPWERCLTGGNCIHPRRNAATLPPAKIRRSGSIRLHKRVAQQLPLRRKRAG
jgi:GMC oxidoreductase